MPGEANPRARTLAVLALVATSVIVIAMIIGSIAGSDDDSGGSNGGQVEAVSGEGDEEGGPSEDPEIQEALQKGEYVVKPGDTLFSIAEQTDIPVEDLQELNPELDPQALITGERVRLR